MPTSLIAPAAKANIQHLSWVAPIAPYGARGQALSLALALAGLKARIGLVDDVNAPLAPDNLVVPVAGTQGFQGVTDFHDQLFVLC
jgi:hypothetical protein